MRKGYYSWLVNNLAAGESTSCPQWNEVFLHAMLVHWFLHSFPYYNKLTQTPHLLTGVYAFGFLSMAPQLFVNYKVCPATDVNNADTVSQWMNDCVTVVSVSAEVCESPAGGSVGVQSECWSWSCHEWIHSRNSRKKPTITHTDVPPLSLYPSSNCPPGSEHTDHRSVLHCLLFLHIRLLLSSPFLLQRWTPVLPLPLPAMVWHSHVTENL